MQQFMLPIVLASVSAFIVILGGLIGGVSFLTILKRFFIFSLLMGGLGFVLNFLLEKWGVIEHSANTNEVHSDEDDEHKNEAQEVQEALGAVELDESFDEGEDSESMFDYTVSDDEDIAFTPMDASVMESSKTKSVNIGGEEIEIEPEKAAGAIRQLLSEDSDAGE